MKQTSNPYPRLHFGFNPSLEFVTALYRAANLELFDEVYSEYRVQQDPQVLEWLKEMRARLSPFMRRELHFFFGVEHSHTNQAFHEVMYYTTVVTVTDGLAMLNRIHPLEVIRCLIDDITEEATREELNTCLARDLAADATPDADEWRKQLANPTPAANRALEALADPKETRDRFVALVNTFYDRAYSEFEPLITTLSRSAIHRFEARFQEDPAQFFTDFFATDPLVYTKDAQVHISAVTQFGCFVALTSRRAVPIFIRLGIRTEEIAGSDVESEQVEKFCKVISDKNRLEIIRLLSNRPWYGQELAKQLQLSPAAVSYHMGFFYAADLVTLKRADQKGYFELDKERLRFLFGLLQKAMNL